MKYIIIFLLTCFSFFIACNITKSVNLLSTDKLETVKYVIDTDRDTTLVTTNGALLNIPKGTLVADNSSTVTLEIKEAYSLQQMIHARLTTQSNGEPLSSAGMIYINAAAGQKVTIKQKIRIAIPADFINKNMQLFKGEQKTGSTINWTNPSPLPENKQAITIDNGKTLFETNCASCHAVGKDLTGPDLAHFMKRFPLTDENIKYYNAHLLQTASSPGIEEITADSTHKNLDTLPHYYHPDLYECNLQSIFGSIGIPFPDLGIDNIKDIYRYIQSESDRLNLPLPCHAYLKDCVDSCKRYKNRITDLAIQRKNAVKDNGSMVKQKKQPVAPSPVNLNQFPSTPASAGYDNRVSPRNYESLYYQFSIENFGWFNIDMLMKGQNGVEESELFVRIKGQYTEKINVYLVIPSLKVFLEGGPTDNTADQYAFITKDGKIPLPQNAKAYLMAITETESSLAYSINEFTISQQQSMDVSLSAATKETFNLAIEKLSLDEVKIQADNSKNAAQIRQLDAQIRDAESLKPKGCSCDCGSK